MTKESSISRDKLSLAIIGPGKVGTALALASDWPVMVVGARDRSRAARLADALGGAVAVGSPAEAAAAADLVLLTVADDAIGAVCDDLAARGAFRAGAVVVHCSGALSSEVLASARDRCRCAVASMHPLQTFPDAEPATDRIAGTFFFCEGDEAALPVVERFVGAVGGRFVRIGGDVKALYHAGAVMACNYLTALLDAACSLMEQAGVERADALQALMPMATATLRNVAAAGPGQALTGPIARGDVQTLRRHLDALAGQGDVETLYRAAGRWTTELARRTGRIDEAAYRALRELLE